MALLALGALVKAAMGAALAATVQARVLATDGAVRRALVDMLP